MAAALHPPGPKPRFPLAHFLSFWRDPLPFLTRLARDHGDVAHVPFGGFHFFMVNHPDLVRDVLVTRSASFAKGVVLARTKPLLGEGLLTSEGARHLRQRRLVQPAFHRDRVATYAYVMASYAVRAQAGWRDGDTLDIAEEMRGLTLAIVGKTLFDADVEGEADDVGAALASLLELSGSLWILFPWLEWLPLPGTRRALRSREQLEAVVAHMIRDRWRTGDRGDLLSTLLFARDEGGEGMTPAQVRDEAMTLFLAGHETTANALAWTWYLLAQNPAECERLHAELDEVLAGSIPSAEDVPRLAYTRMVLAESMRLYPPAWGIGRRAVEDCELGGYLVPEGSAVFVSQHVMHRDPRYYPDPERFDPLRWLPEAQARRPRFAYFPFGAGNRVCIGEPFAWMEGVLLLAAIAQRWRMRLVPGHPIAPLPRITLRPKHGVRVSLERRR